MSGRVELRQAFDMSTRMSLAEGDLDEFERKLDKIDTRLGKIMATCLSILVSLVVASVLLAVNLTVKG